MMHGLAAAPPIFHVLQDDALTILPYARGVYAPDTLYGLWRLMYDNNALRQVFYMQAVRHERERGDLPFFMEYFTNAWLFLVYDQETLAGAVWFTDTTAYKGNIGVFYRKASRGAFAREATDRVCRFAFQHGGYRMIWGFTPWRAALQLGLEIGFELIATLPDYVQIGMRWHPMYLARRTSILEDYTP